MCGISGILSFNEKVNRTSIQNMISTLHHRGPDGDGIWLNDSQQIGLGHKRLSILDLSETGRQPMHFANNRYTITFNGEIYNYLELKKGLENKGYKFQSHSDTEVLLALYDQQKEKALFHLEGMFAFAIWDEKEKTLFCARDRFGEKPFFYHQKDNVFYFASEMKALFAANVPKEKNQKKIYNYIQYGNIEDPTDRGATFFKNVLQLEPAHYLIITPDSTTKKQYWDLHIEKENKLSEKESIEKFRELFLSSINRRLRSDVPVGSSLSGGLDSSAIVMMIDQIKKPGHIQKTFSARFKNFSKDEGKFMQMVIEKTKVQPHFVYPTLDSVINNFQTIAYHQEEPMGSASVAIQYEVMKLAKENNVTVLLDGQGADEAMAGYKHFWPTYFSQLYTGNKKRFSSELMAYRANHNEEPFQDTMAFKWLAYHPASFKYLSDLKRKYKSANSEYFSGIHPDLVNKYRSEPNPIPKINNLKEKLYFFLQRRGLNELLRYADRNAMANSVEVRLPFLDHNLIEFIFTLPDSMLMHQGWTKYILRKSMENILPSEITWRKDKIGFEPPQGEWLSSEYFQEYLFESTEFLKKNKTIVKANPNFSWTYISLFSFEKAF